MRKYLLIALMVLFAAASAANCWAKDMKIGFADKMKILFEYNKTKQLTKDLDEEGQKAKAEADKMSDEIKKMQEEIELLSESAKKEKQPELEKKIQAFNEFRRVKMQELSKRQEDSIKNITDEISTICTQYGKANGYDMILDIRAALYTPEGQDITEKLIDELNKKK